MTTMALLGLLWLFFGCMSNFLWLETLKEKAEKEISTIYFSRKFINRLIAIILLFMGPVPFVTKSIKFIKRKL